MADDTDEARARDNVRNAIQNHKDKLKVLVGIWSYNAPAIADVVKELGNERDFTVVVFDAEPIAIQQIATRATSTRWSCRTPIKWATRASA